MYSKDIEGNSKQIKGLIEIEEEIKDKYGLYSVIAVDKNLKRHSTQYMPEKIDRIIRAVFNYYISDHASYAKEDGYHVVYCEPYKYPNISKIDTEKAKRFGVDLIPLKRSLHDDGTFPFKIIISNPGDLNKTDI